MIARRVALLAAVALAAAPMGACTAKKNSNKPGLTISGPGPEILVGGLMIAGGVALAANVGSEDDQFNAQQTVFVLGVGVAVVGAILVGHGIYRLSSSPAPAQPPPAPP